MVISVPTQVFPRRSQKKLALTLNDNNPRVNLITEEYLTASNC